MLFKLQVLQGSGSQRIADALRDQRSVDSALESNLVSIVSYQVNVAKSPKRRSTFKIAIPWGSSFPNYLCASWITFRSVIEFNGNARATCSKSVCFRFEKYMELLWVGDRVGDSITNSFDLNRAFNLFEEDLASSWSARVEIGSERVIGPKLRIKIRFGFSSSQSKWTDLPSR